MEDSAEYLELRLVQVIDLVKDKCLLQIRVCYFLKG